MQPWRPRKKKSSINGPTNSRRWGYGDGARLELYRAMRANPSLTRRYPYEISNVRDDGSGLGNSSERLPCTHKRQNWREFVRFQKKAEDLASSSWSSGVSSLGVGSTSQCRNGEGIKASGCLLDTRYCVGEEGKVRVFGNEKRVSAGIEPLALADRVGLLALNLGRVMALGMVFAALGFGPRVFSGHAMAAAPVMTRVEDVEDVDIGDVGEEDVDDDEELSDRKFEQLQREEEAERIEREQQLRAALGIDQKLEDVEALWRQAERDSKTRAMFGEKIQEAVREMYADGRRLRALKLKELEAEVEELQREMEGYAKRAERTADEFAAAQLELQKLDNVEFEDDWEKRDSLESAAKDAEVRFGEHWQKVLDMQDEMEEKKMWVESALSDDLPRVLEKSEADLYQAFQQHLLRQSGNKNSGEDGSPNADKVQIGELVKDYEMSADIARNQTLLPLALDVEDSEQPAIEIDSETEKLYDEIQGELERGLTGDPTFPPGLEAALGWRAWVNERKAEFKQYLLDNPEIGREYVKEKQEQILIARDRVVAETWFNKTNKQWEMAPMAASHAVTRKLVSGARVRHDRKVMLLTLKGDDREYRVDIGALDAELRDAGGFDALCMKMATSGTPPNTEFMWIPFREWPVWDLFQLPFKVVWWLLEDIWNSPLLLSVRPWYFQTLFETFEEIMIRFGFPLIQTIMPLQARVALGFDLPEGAEVAEPTNVMVWQQEAQKKVDGRYGEGTGSPAWWISLPIRTYIVGIPLFVLFSFVGGTLLAPLRPRKLELNEAQWKEQKQEQLEKEINREVKKDVLDPIKNVFDNMKRVKRPQVRLQDFAGIDSVKEEILEVISFLRNPQVFKEMGARPPRGVLICGDSGTGKTTLALAIAAEAKVPVVELQGAELEGGAWVGQGASNVRELFKTARELAPLIIFMDDFDHFAGVRGATSDTRKQDHESLINQLLVELDGFETQEGVVLIATTSRPYAIDEALRRPGRMDRTIQLPMPNQSEREQILRKVAVDTMDPNHEKHVDWTEVAEKTAGLTPAQLKCVPRALEANAAGYKIADDEELSSVAGWLATFNTVMPMWFKKTKLVRKWNENLIDFLGLRLSKEDIQAAVETMDVFGESHPGLELENPPVVWTREYKFPHAVWAAGRVLVALLLPNFDIVDQAWLDPTSWNGVAFTKLTSRLEGGYQETGILTRTYYEKSLVLCFGPYVAGRLLLPFGENNNLSRGEWENAEELAAEMVLQYGWGPDDSALIYHKAGNENGLSMGDRYEEELEAKGNKVFQVALLRCAEMLERNELTLRALVEHLLQYDCLSRQDMARILEETGAVAEDEPFELVPYTHADLLSGSMNGSTYVTKTLPAGASN